MSPFRKITQQLNDLELKSPELEDFATPVIAPPDLWPRSKTPTHCNNKLVRSNSLTELRCSPSLTLDIDVVQNIQRTIRDYNDQLQRNPNRESTSQTNESFENMEGKFKSLPVNLNSNIEYNNRILKEEDDDLYEQSSSQNVKKTIRCSKPIKALPQTPADCSSYHSASVSVHNARFLDTKMMSTSPSANYYRPTEEPEPLDLTQLNIEASVMCLVSKIKFLCGRCGSPAIRLRHPKAAIKRAGFGKNPAPDIINNGNPPTISSLERNAAEETGHSPNGNNNELNLNTTQPVLISDNQASPPRRGNKFTDGMII